jgi:hypothetical protein
LTLVFPHCSDQAVELRGCRHSAGARGQDSLPVSRMGAARAATARLRSETV